MSVRQAIVFIVLFSTFAAFAKGPKNPHADAFSRLEKESSLFEKNRKAKKFRHNFEKLASKWERLGRAHPNREQAASAFLHAADLYERVADISHFKPNYEKAALCLLNAAEKTKTAREQDELLMRVMRLYVVQMGDRQAAADVIGPFLAKQRAKKRKLPDAEQWLAEFNRAAKKPKEKKVDAEPIAKIKKVELVRTDDGVGLSIVSSGDLQIKQGVIPKSENSKRRVYFDLAHSMLDPAAETVFDVGQNGIEQIRLAQNQNDVVRIVAEVEKSLPVHVKADSIPLEIWFGQTPLLEEEEEVAEQPAKPIKDEDAPLGLALRKIVIDPGHGGHDPGAIGKGGLKEKDVTLSISQKLKLELEEKMPGVKVYLTRDTDKYVALGDRTEFANSLEADLFISVHVNSSPNRKTQGIETYYLNISHDRYAVRLASRENAMSESEISNLQFILADLAMKANVSDSVRLGREVQVSTHGHVQNKWSDVKDLGLKHALFYVLLGARMPAVLVETAFISNRADEKRLRTDKYQNAIVAGITKGILRYSEQKQAMYQP